MVLPLLGKTLKMLPIVDQVHDEHYFEGTGYAHWERR